MGPHAHGLAGAALVLTDRAMDSADWDHRFTSDDVVGDLAALSIERAERVQRVLATDEGERRAIDALVRAVRR
jgi:hypothetical protein